MQEKSAVWGENGTFLVESKEGGELDGESGESHSTEKEERRESGLNQDEIDEEDEQDSMNNEYFAGGMGLLGFLVQTMILSHPNSDKYYAIIKKSAKHDKLADMSCPEICWH